MSHIIWPFLKENTKLLYWWNLKIVEILSARWSVSTTTIEHDRTGNQWDGYQSWCINRAMNHRIMRAIITLFYLILTAVLGLVLFYLIDRVYKTIQASLLLAITTSTLLSVITIHCLVNKLRNIGQIRTVSDLEGKWGQVLQLSWTAWTAWTAWKTSSWTDCF